MSEKKERSKWVPLLIFAIGIVPMLLAWVVTQNPELVSTYSNNGILINPVQPVDYAQLKGIDKFSEENRKELDNHWILLHAVVPSDQSLCNDNCVKSVYSTKQIRLMLNKDLTRVRRLIVYPDTGKPDPELWAEDEALLRMDSSGTLYDQLKQSVGQPLESGMLFVVDPLGNLMMWYPAGYDPYDVRKDLKRLLNVSQIG